MLLTVIWVFEASIGLIAAVLVLGETLAIHAGLKKRDVDVARNYRIEILRDMVILGAQTLNVLIGLIAALAADHSKDGLGSVAGILTVVGLMAIPALLGLISLSTFRARRH
jgi:hypothetical protein